MAAGPRDVHYIGLAATRVPTHFENLIPPEFALRDAVMADRTARRAFTRFATMRRTSTRTGVSGDAVLTWSYIVVNQIANYVPFLVSSGVVSAAIRRGANGLEFTDVEVILDTTNSVNLADLHADVNALMSASGSSRWHRCHHRRRRGHRCRAGPVLPNAFRE